MRMKSPPNQVYDECLEKDGDLLSGVVCSNLACLFVALTNSFLQVLNKNGYLWCNHVNLRIPVMPLSVLDTCVAIIFFGYLVCQQTFGYLVCQQTFWIPQLPISAIGYLVGQFQFCWPISD